MLVCFAANSLLALFFSPNLFFVKSTSLRALNFSNQNRLTAIHVEHALLHHYPYSFSTTERKVPRSAGDDTQQEADTENVTPHTITIAKKESPRK